MDFKAKSDETETEMHWSISILNRGLSFSVTGGSDGRFNDGLGSQICVRGKDVSRVHSDGAGDALTFAVKAVTVAVAVS